MLNEAHYQHDWAEGSLAQDRPYMETNRWLSAVRPTRDARLRQPAESEHIDIMGVKLVWTKDGSRPFPGPVLNVIKDLLTFAELESNWDSYGGHGLRAEAVPTVMHLVITSHQHANVPRLHPLGDGGVGLSWGAGALELEILVAADGTAEGLFTDGNDEVELEPGSDPRDATSLLEKFFARR